jgi:hypothetical protein
VRGPSGPIRLQWAIDWAFLESSCAPELGSTESIPYAGHRSYIDLANAGSARDLGWIMGRTPSPSSPLAIASPKGSRFRRRSSAVLSAGTGWKVTRQRSAAALAMVPRLVEDDAFRGDAELADVGIVSGCAGLEHRHGTP